MLSHPDEYSDVKFASFPPEYVVMYTSSNRIANKKIDKFLQSKVEENETNQGQRVVLNNGYKLEQKYFVELRKSERFE